MRLVADWLAVARCRPLAVADHDRGLISPSVVGRSAASTPRRGPDGVRDRATAGAGIRREPPLALFTAPGGSMADPTQLAREAAPARRQPGGAVEAAGMFRPVVYEGGPAPPVAYALRPRSIQLAPPAVRDGGLRARRGGCAGAGGDAAELRARLAGRPGLHARRASHARAQGWPADPGDGGAVPDAPPRVHALSARARPVRAPGRRAGHARRPGGALVRARG